MKKYLYWSLALAILALYMTAPALAQDEGATNFLSGRPTLWLAIVIGFVASGATGVYSYQLQGGVVGTALMFITGGMFLVVLGFLAVVVQWTGPNTQALVHDVLFIIGYILMIVGALRLRQMIR